MDTKILTTNGTTKQVRYLLKINLKFISLNIRRRLQASAESEKNFRLTNISQYSPGVIWRHKKWKICQKSLLFFAFSVAIWISIAKFSLRLLLWRVWLGAWRREWNVVPFVAKLTFHYLWILLFRIPSNSMSLLVRIFLKRILTDSSFFFDENRIRIAKYISI